MISHFTAHTIKVLQTLIFFSGLHSEKKLGLYYKPETNPGAKPKKNQGLHDLRFFLGFEIDLDFSRP